MPNLFAQQNGLSSLGGMGSNYGNFGSSFGSNLLGPNFAGNQNTAALLQQLMSQQSGVGGFSNVTGIKGNSSAASKMLSQQIQPQQRLGFGGTTGATGQQPLVGGNHATQSFLGVKRNFGDMNDGGVISGTDDAKDGGGPFKKATL